MKAFVYNDNILFCEELSVQREERGINLFKRKK